MLNQNDLHWLSGILEGEGYFGIMADGDNKTFRVQVCSTDEDVIIRASKILLGYNRVGVSKNKPYRKKNYYQVNVNGKDAIAWMMTLYSLMGIRRKARIREIINIWISYSRANDNCRTCGAIYSKVGRYRTRPRSGESIMRCRACAAHARKI